MLWLWLPGRSGRAASALVAWPHEVGTAHFLDSRAPAVASQTARRAAAAPHLRAHGPQRHYAARPSPRAGIRAGNQSQAFRREPGSVGAGPSLRRTPILRGLGFAHAPRSSTAARRSVSARPVATVFSAQAALDSLAQAVVVFDFTCRGAEPRHRRFGVVFFRRRRPRRALFFRCRRYFRRRCLFRRRPLSLRRRQRGQRPSRKRLAGDRRAPCRPRRRLV